jgi:PAS domain-containing protein
VTLHVYVRVVVRDSGAVREKLELAPGVAIDLSGVPDLQAVTDALRRAVPGTALYFFDRHLRVILAGGPALADAGWSPTELEGRLLEDVLERDVYAEVEPHYRDALASGEPSSFDMQRPQAFFHVDVAPVRNESGTVIGLYAFARAR